MTEMDKLIAERRDLVDALDYSADDMPGSPRWRATQAAQARLDAFDAVHPEIARVIRQREADRKAHGPQTIEDIYR